MNEYFRNVMQELSASLATLDDENFNQLVDECEQTLKAGRQVIVSGLGKNVPVCEKFVGTMNSMGLNARYMNTNSAVHGDIGMVHENDLVIILTKSGETVESVYLTNLLKKRGANIWLLSFSKDSTLTHAIPKQLLMELDNEGDAWNIAPNNSATLNLIVLQGVAIELIRRMGVELSDFKMNHPGGFIGEQLKNV